MHVPRGFIVLFASTLAAIVNEMIAWGLVFRTDHYKRLKQNLLQAEKRLETLKSNTASKAKSKKKKETRTEHQMKANMTELQKTRTMVMVAVCPRLFKRMHVDSYMHWTIAGYAGQPNVIRPDGPSASVSGVLMLILYQVLSRGFKGVAVARLPFEPMPLLRYFTHRGLPADADPRNVSVSFVYLLCQVTLRAVVSKVFNFGVRPSLQKILLEDANPLFGLPPPGKDD